MRIPTTRPKALEFSKAPERVLYWGRFQSANLPKETGLSKILWLLGLKKR